MSARPYPAGSRASGGTGLVSRLASCSLVILIVLLASPGAASEDKFPHLLKQVDPHTRRLHLISEVVQGDHKVQVEEYLDLDAHSQLIQLKWHVDSQGNSAAAASRAKQQQLTTHKINVLLLNGKDASVLYEYKPYECASIKLDGQNHLDGVANWNAFEAPVGSESGIPEGQAAALLAKSIVSTALDSPYLVRVPAKGDHGAERDKWVSGIAGLWLSAQFGRAAEKPPEHSGQVMGNKVLSREGAWRLYRPGGFVVDFHMRSNQEVGGPAPRGRAGAPLQFESPELIKVRHASQPEESRQHTINVFRLELDYGDQLAANLFTLPIGFDCPANPLLSTQGLYLRRDQAPSALTRLELVASRARTSEPPLVDARTIELAQARHPTDPGARLTMFASRESRYKAVQDHSLRLEYRMLQVPGSRAARQVQCFAEHLQYEGPDGKSWSSSSNQVRFEANKLQLDLSEFHLNFLLGLLPPTSSSSQDSAQEPPSSKDHLGRMRLLNSFEISDTLDELVFESQVPSEHLGLLVDLSGGGQRELQMRVVRVYERQLVKSTLSEKVKVRRGSLELARVLLLVFTGDHSERVAEIRLNLVEDKQLMSFRERARLFDLTRCREDSMELVVRYPAEPALLDFVDEHTSTLLERFYGSSLNWLPKRTATQTPESPEALQKRRLGASLNHLRVPKAELRRSQLGDLELHLTILEKAFPLDVFELISGVTFTTSEDGGDGRLSDQDETQFEQPALAGSARECARMCQHFECKMFAYDAGRHECRMSHLVPEERSLSCHVRGKTNSSSSCVADTASPRVKLEARAQSELYFEPPYLSQRPMDEATLAELVSYIEHSSYDLEQTLKPGSESGDDDSAALTSRQKRQTTPERMPLFAFDFDDRSGARSEYEPPVQRLLVPSELSVRRLPLVLNVARDGPQMERVNRAFSVRHTGKAYKLTALDGDAASTSDHDQPETNERLFRDSKRQVYYTLERVLSVSQENCALLCHNIEQWDARTGGEQTCVSFSYGAVAIARDDAQCLLLVKTDFKFLKADGPGGILELAREGDRVLELETPEQLMADSYGAVVAFRNYLLEFEGPLRVGELAFGSNSLDSPSLRQKYAQLGLELEWLDALVAESDEEDGQADVREECAQKCLERNRATAASEMCLALDHCTSSPAPLLDQSGGGARRHKQVCRQLLVKGEQLNANRQLVGPIRRLRSHLIDARAPGGETTNAPTRPPATCNRYILSHLYEFNHLARRRLAAEGEQATSKLAKTSETTYGTNLDSCALECSLRPPTDCLLFEFCQSLGVAGAQPGSLERNCTMFRRSDLGTPTRNGATEKEPSDGGRTQLTSYHKDCHLYVRRDFGSIEQALSEGALERLVPGRRTSFQEFQHTCLTIGFSIVYLAAVIGLIVFVVHLRRRRVATEAREGVAIMMTQINERLAQRA